MTDNNSRPLISVITPTYNRATLLKRAVSSVLNQTYTNFEMIIVDDCSKDNTEQAVGNINDNRIKYIKLGSNKGPAGARNIAIKSARGQYITLLDSDDEYLPNKLELQINKFRELPEQVGVVYSGYLIVYEPDTVHGTVLPRYNGNLFDILLKHNCMGSPTPLIRKECFDTCGLFDESLPSYDDWDMWIRISEKFKFEYVNEPLAKVYTHGEQTSTNIESTIKVRDLLFKKYEEFILKNPGTASYLLQRLGFLYYLKNDTFMGLKYYLRSIATNPKEYENYITLLTAIISKDRHMKRMKGSSIREANNITVYF